MKTLFVLESFLFVLFQRHWMKKLFAKTRELKLKFALTRLFVCVFFFNWFDHRQILNTSTLDTRIQFTQFPSINQKPFVDGRRVAKKGIFRQFLFFGLVFG